MSMMTPFTRELLEKRFGPNYDDVINYVPDEICVVVEGALSDRIDGNHAYDLVRGQLNRWLQDFLRAPRDEDENAFARDTGAPGLRRLRAEGMTQANRGLLQPVQRAESRSPWVHFAAPESANAKRVPARSLFFYQIGPTRLTAAETYDRPRLNERTELVRELTNSLNLNLTTFATIESTPLRVVAATPNWLQVAAQITCGSPGGRPVPVAVDPPPRRPLFAFESLELAARARAAAERGAGASDNSAADVVVAVLDTCPDLRPDPHTESGARRKNWLDALERTNWLFRQVRHHASLDDAPSLRPIDLAHLDPILPNWNGPPNLPGVGHGAFRIADHGLFVAGIVQHLAPGSSVHLLRILNDVGVGDLLAIAQVAQQLPARFLSKTGRRLVVNLSLGSDVPTGERRVARWFPHLFGDQRTLSQHHHDVQALLEQSVESLATIFNWLERQDVVVVAAVGNDNQPGDARREEPRWPAHFDSVFGVAALKGDATPADYTNLGDERSTAEDNGIATFGGNAVLSTGSSGPRDTDVADAVVGIYSAEEFPFGQGANHNGWAYWAGTSFATPIISALIAQEWILHPHLTARDVIAAVRARAESGGSALRAPIIPAKSTI